MDDPSMLTNQFIFTSRVLILKINKYLSRLFWINSLCWIWYSYCFWFNLSIHKP